MVSEGSTAGSEAHHIPVIDPAVDVKKSLRFFSPDLGNEGAYVNPDNDMGFDPRTVMLKLWVTHVDPAYEQKKPMEIYVEDVMIIWEKDRMTNQVESWALRFVQHDLPIANRFQWRVFLAGRDGVGNLIDLKGLYDVGSDQAGEITIVPVELSTTPRN